MLTQFLASDDTQRFILVLAITTAFTINNMVAFTLRTQAGDAFARRFRSPESARMLDLFLGLVPAAVAIWMTNAISI